MNDNPYAVPRTFYVPVKACGCGVLLGEECNCVGPTPVVIGPSRPTTLVLALINGRLQQVEDSRAC
jgi:hypothetical protein